MQQLVTPLPTPPPRGAALETPTPTQTQPQPQTRPLTLMQRTPLTPLEPAPPRHSSQRLTTPLDALAEISEVLVEKTSQLAAKERVRANAVLCRRGGTPPSLSSRTAPRSVGDGGRRPVCAVRCFV
jgi:hypothetical protein